MLKKSDFESDISLWPSIEYPDIVNYLVLQTSWVTKTQMKAYKSMEGYNFFVSGWVNDVLVKPVGGDISIIFARVSSKSDVTLVNLHELFLFPLCAGNDVGSHPTLIVLLSGKSLPESTRNSSQNLGFGRKERNSCHCTLQLHGWVSVSVL